MKILMPDGTSSSARQTLYGLEDQHTIDVCAPSAMCQCRFSSKVRRWLRCPPLGAEPKEYARFLIDHLRRGQYDVVLPTHEEVFVLSRFREAIEPYVGVAVPPFPAMQKMLGKIEFAKTMDELSLSTPPFEILSAGSELERYDRFPYYLKLNYATAGLGVRLVRNAADRDAALADFARHRLLDHGPAPVLVQQPASGTMCVVQAVFQHGRSVAIHCAEVVEAGIGGGAMVRVGAQHPRVVDEVRRLGEALQWHGAMFLEYLYDEAAEQAWYIECNPRIGEPVNAQLSGVNLPDLLMRISAGEHVDAAAEPKPGVRSHVGFVRMIALAMKGASRSELLRQLLQLRRGEGIYRDAANEMTRPDEDPLSRIPAAFVMTQLLSRPAAANRLVSGTVNNYALSMAAVRTIEGLPDDWVESLQLA